jgi:hypothetical protein
VSGTVLRFTRGLDTEGRALVEWTLLAMPRTAAVLRWTYRPGPLGRSPSYTLAATEAAVRAAFAPGWAERALEARQDHLCRVEGHTPSAARMIVGPYRHAARLLDPTDDDPPFRIEEAPT